MATKKECPYTDTDEKVVEYYLSGGEIHTCPTAVAKVPQHLNKDVHQSRLARRGK